MTITLTLILIVMKSSSSYSRRQSNLIHNEAAHENHSPIAITINATRPSLQDGPWEGRRLAMTSGMSANNESSREVILKRIMSRKNALTALQR